MRRGLLRVYALELTGDRVRERNERIRPRSLGNVWLFRPPPPSVCEGNNILQSGRTLFGAMT